MGLRQRVGSFLGWLGRRLMAGPHAADQFWYDEVGHTATSGVTVTESNAICHSAVWAATRIISETESSLPLIVYERIPGGKERATDHPLYPLLHDAPNPEMSSITFRDEMTSALVNWGNAFAEIVRDGRNRVMELWPIHPSRVPWQWVKRNEAGEITYRVWNDDNTTTTLPYADVLHIVGALPQSGWGKGVIRQARESIGLGLAVEQFGASFFGEGAMPGGVLEHPGRLSDDARRNLRRSWNERHQGPGRAHRLAILEEGMKYAALSIPPEDAQFLETFSFNIRTIARWYRIPAYMLQEYEKAATYASVEALGIEFVVYSILPWLVRWEQEIHRKLLTRQEQSRYFAEHLLDALLRGDTLTRTQALTQQFLNGALTHDEWRAIENRNPLPGGQGQKHYVPLNLGEVGQASQVAPTVEPPAIEEMPEMDAVPEGMPNNGQADAELENRARRLADAWAQVEKQRKVFEEVSKTPPEILKSSENSAARETATDCLADAIARMLRKETAAAKRAAEKPREFLTWLETFLKTHEELFAEVVAPAVATVLAVASDSRAPAEVAAALAADHCKRTRSELLLACECRPSELPATVARCVAAWPARAREEAESIGTREEVAHG